MLTAVEMFAGGGGLAVGLARAGFTTISAVEVEPDAAATFKVNHPSVKVLNQDVRTVSGQMLLDTLPRGSVDVLAACPPCQGFSSLTSKWGRQDPRDELLNETSRVAEELRPRAIMVENVPGLAKKGRALFDGLLRCLAALGYLINYDVLQVADYGVPQTRRRLVILAGLGFRIEMPPRTHSREGADGLPRWRSLRDAIGHLEDSVSFRDAAKNGCLEAVNWHVVRRLSPANLVRLKLARPGAMWMELPEAVRPPCHRNGYKGFTNVYGRMTWDQPSVTITAGCTSPSKGRFGHPRFDRTISLREAALLQTFPPDYRFETRHLDRACDIVGNALPCDFSEVIARQVASEIKRVREPSHGRRKGRRLRI
jgi:DNA (cytosine-5)-methyltransferase 1